MEIEPAIAYVRGPAALPRLNGELVFNAPWEGRAFGLALALRSHRPYPWMDFQRHLEAEIAAAGPSDDGSHYYERWVAALERLLEAGGLVSEAERRGRTQEYLEGRREEVF